MTDSAKDQDVAWTSSLCRRLGDMQQSSILCDTMLMGSDTVAVPAHACLLVAASPFFKPYLCSGLTNFPILHLKSYTSRTLQYLIQFIYSGVIRAPIGEIPAILTISVDLQIDGLTDMCQELLQKQQNVIKAVGRDRILESKTKSPGHGVIPSQNKITHPVTSQPGVIPTQNKITHHSVTSQPEVIPSQNKITHPSVTSQPGVIPSKNKITHPSVTSQPRVVPPQNKITQHAVRTQPVVIRSQNKITQPSVTTHPGVIPSQNKITQPSVTTHAGVIPSQNKITHPSVTAHPGVIPSQNKITHPSVTAHPGVIPSQNKITHPSVTAHPGVIASQNKITQPSVTTHAGVIPSQNKITHPSVTAHPGVIPSQNKITHPSVTAHPGVIHSQNKITHPSVTTQSGVIPSQNKITHPSVTAHPGVIHSQNKITHPSVTAHPGVIHSQNKITQPSVTTQPGVIPSQNKITHPSVTTQSGVIPSQNKITHPSVTTHAGVIPFQNKITQPSVTTQPGPPSEEAVRDDMIHSHNKEHSESENLVTEQIEMGNTTTNVVGNNANSADVKNTGQKTAVDVMNRKPPKVAFITKLIGGATETACVDQEAMTYSSRAKTIKMAACESSTTRLQICPNTERNGQLRNSKGQRVCHNLAEVSLKRTEGNMAKKDEEIPTFMANDAKSTRCDDIPETLLKVKQEGEDAIKLKPVVPCSGITENNDNKDQCRTAIVETKTRNTHNEEDGEEGNGPTHYEANAAKSTLQVDADSVDIKPAKDDLPGTEKQTSTPTAIRKSSRRVRSRYKTIKPPTTVKRSNKPSSTVEPNQQPAKKKCGRKPKIVLDESGSRIPPHRIKNHMCDICGRLYCKPFELREHVRTHTGEKLYCCDECGQSFVSKNGWRIHNKRKHLKMLRHECEICHKRFFDLKDCRAHQWTHTGEKPYQCDECGLCYRQSSKLVTHRRVVHLGLKPFKCPACGMSFSSKHFLTVHVRSHSDTIFFMCCTCGLAFDSHRRCVKHERSCKPVTITKTSTASSASS